VSFNIHEAMMAFFIQYAPEAEWYYNLNKAETGTINVIPMSGEQWMEQWIDGSGIGYLDFTINIFKTLAGIPVTDDGAGGLLPIQNAEDMMSVQAFMDWIDEQERLENYPNLGDKYTVQKLETLTNIPNPAMTDGTLIKLSFPARVTYYMEGDN
jgi:hypothetical protein